MMYRIRRFPCFVAILIGISCSVSIGCDLPPIAVITSPSGIATWVRAGTSLQFDGCSSWDDGQIVDFNWTWCDNTPSGTTCSANHSYSESAKHYFPELQVTDDGGQSDCACTSIWTASMGFATSSSYPYIPVNDDDDNANGIMDCWETGSVANENDLVGFGLSVTSSSSSRDKVELSVTSTAALQVWDEDSRTWLLITSGDSSEYWTASGITNWVHAEAKNPSAGSKLNDPYLQWRFYGQYSQQYPLYGWNDADESSKRCICVHVDMDLAGVVDDSYPSTITQETTPGGFIPVGSFVALTVKQVQPSSLSPNNPANWSQLTLSASSSKVCIWNATKTQNYGQSPAPFSPTGDTTFYIQGCQASTSLRDVELILTHAVTGFQDKIKLTVFRVNNVIWVTRDDYVQGEHGPNRPLEDIGEIRIFPDKKHPCDTPEETAMRRQVLARAGVTPAIEGVNIEFALFDPDDNSSSVPPLDLNDAGGTPTGDDNKDQSIELPIDSAPTNADGVATVWLSVALYPGDNYRVAASLSRDKLNEVTQPMVDGAAPLPSTVVLSRCLVVWRLLHIERDTMAAAATSGSQANCINGTAQYLSYDQSANRTLISLNLNLSETGFGVTQEDHFYFGRYVVGGTTYKCVDSTYFMYGEYDRVKVIGNAMSQPTSYVLYDDDECSFLSMTVTPVLPANPLPELGSMADEFRRAYIEPVYDTGISDSVSFERNLSTTEIAFGLGDWDDSFDLSPYSCNEFWCVLNVAGFQPGVGEDLDADTEGQTGFAAGSSVDNKTVLFLEVMREKQLDTGAVMAHELGHTGGPGDNACTEGCIMWRNTQQGTLGDHFCDECLHDFRKDLSW